MKEYKIYNDSELQIDNEINSLVNYAKDFFGFSMAPTIFLNHDERNSTKTLAKTGYYDPETQEIHIFVTGRHPKDVLRSIAHELVHHNQNEKGQFANAGFSGKGYAQKNPHLRDMELQAYKLGNICLRDWEDHLKENNPTIYNEGRNKKMSLKEWKDNELNRLLMKKFGIIKEYKGGSGEEFPPSEGPEGFESVPPSEGTEDVQFSQTNLRHPLDKPEKLDDLVKKLMPRLLSSIAMKRNNEILNSKNKFQYSKYEELDIAKDINQASEDAGYYRKDKVEAFVRKLFGTYYSKPRPEGRQHDEEKYAKPLRDAIRQSVPSVFQHGGSDDLAGSGPRVFSSPKR